MVKKLLLLFLLSPLCLYADWIVLDRRDQPVLDGKLAASEFRVSNGVAEAEIKLVYFAAADVRLEVIANTEGRTRALRDAIEAGGGLAGINGGYFDENFEAIGLLISNDHVVHRLQKAKLLSGIFYVRNHLPLLARTEQFPGTKGIHEAIQCGPFLVEAGQTVAGLDNRRVAARTFIFSCDRSEWGFGICRSVTLKEMGDILRQATMVPDHHISRALNFDGGSSTTFYARTDGQTIFSEGRSVVSNYLIAKATH
ncbi:MAG: phosphodiester glycosidase family protein [Verrucomicrobia bacterium]|nr:phosphodiester glycosidase family protein [Verrucomicrobiota bacterium]MBV9642447.1 phosphodiester glycosidase family protein [Verrucomicrobiota bacterium]